MAKATAECKCTECGTVFYKEKDCLNRREADSWESWAAGNYAQCPSCWGKEQREKQESEPLKVTMSCDPYAKTIIFVFGGNTKPYKDDIKELGYRWGELPVSGVFGILSTARAKLGWSKSIHIQNIDDIKTELDKLSSLNPVIENIDIAILQKSNEKQKKIDEVEKPIIPEVLRGHNWNRKVYGKNIIYLDGEKTVLTDEQATELEQYVVDIEEYNKKIEKIKNTQ